jgi:Arc/MetJ-type ribon-helix-helix transcriptional regulator
VSSDEPEFLDVDGVATSKVMVTLPTDVLKLAEEQVKAGRAKSLSALVSDAVKEKVRRNELLEILDGVDARLGKPVKRAGRWAKRVLQR